MTRHVWIGCLALWACESPTPPTPLDDTDSEAPPASDTLVVIDDTASPCGNGQIRVAHLCIEAWSERWMDVTALMVREVPLPSEGVSVVAAFGEQAFPVRWDERYHTWMAASSAGSGKILAIGTDALPRSGQEGLAVTDHALRWLDTSDNASLVHLGGLDAWKTPLESLSWTIRDAAVDELNSGDVAIIHAATALSADDVTALITFVNDGGSVVVAGHAAAPTFQGQTAGAGLLPLNDLLRSFGLVITAMDAPDPLSPAPADPPWLEQHAAGAMLALKQSAQDPLSVGIFSLARARIAAESALWSLPATDSAYYDVFLPLYEAYGAVRPTPDAPVDPDFDIAAGVLAIWEHRRHLDLEMPSAHPSAVDFPRVPTQNAVPTTVSLSLDLSYEGVGEALTFAEPNAPRLVSTGIWALPGESLVVGVPASASDVGIGLQIGIHTSEPWDTGPWWRFPAVTKTRPIEATTTSITSAFGGPVYLTVPPGCLMGEVDVTVSGGVAMPTFRAGATTSWVAELKQPAPMGELIGEHVVLTLPREQLEALSAPDAVTAFWDAVLEAHATLMGLDPRPRRERIFIDIAQYSESQQGGYPLDISGEAGVLLTDLETLAVSGHWSLTTALAYNAVHEQLTLPTAPGVLPQLLSVYTFETVIGGSINDAHPFLQPAVRAGYRMSYLQPPTNFTEYNDWLGTDAWLLIAESEGWPELSAVFELYPQDLVTVVDEPIPGRLDRQMVLTCTELATNACPYFTMWGWPVSNGACNICSNQGPILAPAP
ncbi:MAG: M60 family peptidase N-terminal accessory domain-containing protein [Myxococcota bacterium]